MGANPHESLQGCSISQGYRVLESEECLSGHEGTFRWCNDAMRTSGRDFLQILLWTDLRFNPSHPCWSTNRYWWSVPKSICGNCMRITQRAPVEVQPNHIPHYLHDPQSPTVTFPAFKTTQCYLHDCNLPICLHYRKLIFPLVTKTTWGVYEATPNYGCCHQIITAAKNYQGTRKSYPHSCLAKRVEINTSSLFGRVIPSCGSLHYV